MHPKRALFADSEQQRPPPLPRLIPPPPPPPRPTPTHSAEQNGAVPVVCCCFPDVLLRGDKPKLTVHKNTLANIPFNDFWGHIYLFLLKRWHSVNLVSPSRLVSTILLIGSLQVGQNSADSVDYNIMFPTLLIVLISCFKLYSQLIFRLC